MTNHDNRHAIPQIDFLSRSLCYRYRQATLRNEWLAKAIGHPRHHPVVIDATAGLGKDSFVLAVLGFKVIMLEQSPLLCTLLKQALERAKVVYPAAVERLQLIETEAIQWLTALSPAQRPSVIYLDPMFPVRKKSASSNKNMVILQNLLSKDKNKDEGSLFKAAYTCATQKVVVKRYKLDNNISEHAVNFSLKCRSCRLDVYVKHDSKESV